METGDGTIRLPPGYDWVDGYGTWSAQTKKEVELPKGGDQYTFNFSNWDEEEKKARKERGECEQCGTKREMSIHGLLDCPNHPKDPGYR